MYVLKSEQMYKAECNAVKNGITFACLMEKAGNACAEIFRDKFSVNDYKNVLVICGKGKNAGDGFVIARKLAEYGYFPKVVLLYGEPKDDISIANYKLLSKEQIAKTENIKELIGDCDAIVDAVFGTGFKGVLDETTSKVVALANKSGKPILSIDIPSGANCDSGEIQGECFNATVTAAISAYKPIHIFKPDNSVCGKVVLANIGMTEEDFNLEETTAFVMTEKDIKKLLPARISNSNKGTYGTALCVCGSKSMAGAAKIASLGALKSGAGLVVTAFPESAYNAIAPSTLENILLPVEDKNGYFCLNSADIILEKAKKSTALLVGCGIGTNIDTKRFVNKLLRECEIPMVLDADALNCIGSNTYLLKKAKAPVVITPHPGEMSRLTGKTVEEITTNPVKIAEEFAKEFNCIVLLKGANSVVCSPTEKRVYINTTGNTALSKGGSGDLLSGILVSLMAQRMSPFDAACAASFILGKGAELLSEYSSERSITVGDIISHLGTVFKAIEQR